MKIQFVCEDCGGSDVLRDARAGWSPVLQHWQLHNMFDDAFCETCEKSTKLKEIPYEDSTLKDAHTQLLKDVYTQLASKQERLGREIETIIFDEIEELYEK